MRKLLITALTGCLLAVGIATAGPASAEGHRLTYINNASEGFQSQPWTDYNEDDGTGFIEFVNCSSNVEITVFDTWDGRQVARGILWCLHTIARLNIGDVGAGTYRFKIVDIRGASRISVDSVAIVW